MKPGPSGKEDTRERKKRQDHARYEIRKALLDKEGEKYRRLYRCPGCFKRKKLRLHRIRKGKDLPKESDYILLCHECITKRREEQRKTRKWRRTPGTKGTSRQAFIAKLKPLVFARDGHQCVWCGAKDKLGLGPLIPPSRGGKVCLDNYVVTCAACRPAKGNKLPLEFIFEKISMEEFWKEQDLTVQAPGGVLARMNLHLLAEVSQFLSRVIVDESISREVRNKAERLCIKLNEDEREKKAERSAHALRNF